MQVDLYNWMLVFARTGAFLMILPFFSAVNFPTMARIALSAMAAMLISPILPTFPVEHLGILSLAALLDREITIGLLLGFLSRMVFYAADIAGLIISTELGLNMGMIMDPASRQPEQIPGLLLSLLSIVTMLTLDLHHGLLLGFARTFDVLPIGSGQLSPTLFENVVHHTAQIFVVALQIAAPVMAVSFVITVFFAIMARAVPQMNVFSESFGIRIAGGLIVFGFTLHIAAQYVANYLHRLPDDLLSFGKILNGV